MKNVFGYPYSKTEDMPCDGARFVTERVDPAFKSEIDSSKQRIEEVKKKGRMPLIKLFLGGMFAPIGMYIYIRVMEMTDSMDIIAAFSVEPLLCTAFVLCMLIAAGTIVMLFVTNKKAQSSPELKEANARLASLDKNSEIMLGLPQEYEKVDVLSFEYVEKDGKVRIKDTQPYRYLNSEMKLYKNGDMLCLADIERVYSFPIADIKKYVLKKRKTIISGWNKETPYNEGRYIQYRLSKNDSGSINCKFCAMRCADSFGEYEVFFPVYELEAFKAIADAPTEKE